MAVGAAARSERVVFEKEGRGLLFESGERVAYKCGGKRCSRC